MQVGFVAGADLPLPPPEPFQPQHQEHAQPIAQQLSQPLPDPASEGEILQKQHPAQEEAALQPAPVQLSTGLSTRASREVSQEISTGARQTEQTEGRPEAAPTTKTYAVADVIDVTKNSNLAAGTTGSDHGTVVDAKAGGGDFDRGEEGEGRSTTSHLLGRFAVLHREGRLEEAAATLQQALHIMESKRRNTVRRGVGRQQDSDLLDASSIVDEDGTGPNNFAEDSKRAQLGETKSLGRPEKGKISVEREVVAGGGRLVSEAEASTIAGVMNDLGCTLQQVKGAGGSGSASGARTCLSRLWSPISRNHAPAISLFPSYFCNIWAPRVRVEPSVPPCYRYPLSWLPPITVDWVPCM